MDTFDAAIARVTSFGSSIAVSVTDKLQLYALFKQARSGDYAQNAAPSRFNMEAYAKYSAWAKCEGMTAETAKGEYVKLVRRLDPSWVAAKPNEVEKTTRGLEQGAEVEKSAGMDGGKTAGVDGVKSVGISADGVISGEVSGHGVKSVATDGVKSDGIPVYGAKLVGADDAKFAGILVNGVKPSAAPDDVPAKPSTIPIELAGTVSSPTKSKLSQFYAPKTSEKPKLSGMMERALFGTPADGQMLPSPIRRPLTMTETPARTRIHNLDVNFVVSPFGPLERIEDDIKRLVEHTSSTSKTLILQGADDFGDSGLRARLVMTRHSLTERFENVGNVRDLGGLPAIAHDGKPGMVRKNLLIRCSHLDRLSSNEANFFATEFNVRTIVDLRSNPSMKGPLAGMFENTTDVDKLAQLRKTSSDRIRISLPLLSADMFRKIAVSALNVPQKIVLAVLSVLAGGLSFVRKLLCAVPVIATAGEYLQELEKMLQIAIRYIAGRAFSQCGLKNFTKEMLIVGKDNIKKTLVILGDSANHPALFHCAFGKDRTGVTAALMLHVCGTPRDFILDDYEMSHKFVDTPAGILEWEVVKAEVPNMYDMKEDWGRSPREYLQHAFACIEKEFGSVDGYLKSMGLEEEWVKSVRKALVVGDSV